MPSMNLTKCMTFPPDNLITQTKKERAIKRKEKQAMSSPGSLLLIGPLAFVDEEWEAMASATSLTLKVRPL